MEEAVPLDPKLPLLAMAAAAVSIAFKSRPVKKPATIPVKFSRRRPYLKPVDGIGHAMFGWPMFGWPMFGWPMEEEAKIRVHHNTKLASGRRQHRDDAIGDRCPRACRSAEDVGLAVSTSAGAKSGPVAVAQVDFATVHLEGPDGIAMQVNTSLVTGLRTYCHSFCRKSQAPQPCNGPIVQKTAIPSIQSNLRKPTFTAHHLPVTDLRKSSSTGSNETGTGTVSIKAATSI
jgi:hypothetical protein